MLWFARRPVRPIRRTPRRSTLRLDCLEDRFAPAGLGIFGSAAAEAVPIATRVGDLDFNPARINIVEGASANRPAARADDTIGFFHAFCRNGFQSGEIIEIENLAPRPRPVTPPALPVATVTQRIPLAQPATLVLDPPAEPLETPPMPAASEPPDVIPANLKPSPRPADEPAPSAAPPSIAHDAQAPSDTIGYVVTSTRSNPPTRKGFAAAGGLIAAAGFLYLRNPGDRRRESSL